MTIESFQEGVRHYGYLFVLLGTFLEGDIALILGGICATSDLGLLCLPGVMLAGFTGAIIGDQVFYNLGRFKGLQVLNRFPRLKLRADRVFHHLRRHGSLIAFAFRFFYGFRILTPLMIGASGVGRGKFTFLNCLGAASWAALLGGLGYLIGELVLAFLSRMKESAHHWLPLIIGGLLLLAGLIRLLVWLVRRRRANRALREKAATEQQKLGGTEISNIE